MLQHAHIKTRNVSNFNDHGSNMLNHAISANLIPNLGVAGSNPAGIAKRLSTIRQLQVLFKQRLSWPLVGVTLGQRSAKRREQPVKQIRCV